MAEEDLLLVEELTRLRFAINDVLGARYRQALPRPTTSTTCIRTPKDVAELLQAEMQELPQEQFRVVLVTAKNTVLDVITLYQGTLTSAPIRVGEVFRPAILANAASFIAVHCHPSGDPTPSPEDVQVTRALVQAGALLDIACLDHIILGHGRFVSLKERQLGFP